VDHAQPLPTPFPWRAVAVLAAGIALAELVALIAVGLIRAAPHAHTVPKAVAAPRAAAHIRAIAQPKIPSVPLRPRSQVRVLVLNGNGVGGAAATEAAQLQARGYHVGGATNAGRHDYAQSMVMFVPGWVKEARRLARDTGIRMVAPVDGLRPAQLARSKIVILLGK
jgi:hypothetical protein